MDRKYDGNRIAATGGGVWEMVNLPVGSSATLPYQPSVEGGALGMTFTSSRTHLHAKPRPKLHPLVMNYVSFNSFLSIALCLIDPYRFLFRLLPSVN